MMFAGRALATAASQAAAAATNVAEATIIAAALAAAAAALVAAAAAAAAAGHATSACPEQALRGAGVTIVKPCRRDEGAPGARSGLSQNGYGLLQHVSDKIDKCLEFM